MASTLKGLSGLEFGVPTVTGVVLQNLSTHTAGKVTDATDEDGDTVGLAFYGSTRMDIEGEYLYKGADIAAVAAAITIAGVGAPGDIYCVEFGRKKTNTGYTHGSFKAISVTGITG